MAKQIIITEGDYGIELQVQFLDSSKNPVDLTDCFVEIDFVNPNSELSTKQAQIVDYINGRCSYILTTSETNLTDLWKTYWKVFNDNNYITAQEEIYYYVKSKDGGI